jgi:hypothetical protein
LVTSAASPEQPEENIYLKNIINLKNISAILGPGKWIIKGCKESIENGIKYILPGTVVIIYDSDNEIELISVSKQPYNEFCYILKEESTKSFSVVKNLIFGQSKSCNMNLRWNEFRKIDKLSDIINKNSELNKTINELRNEVITLKKNQIPKGSIIMWSGTNIPSGYALCDGKNGTPNLVNKFIIGSSGNYKIGETGGNEKIKLSVNQLPPHNHNFMQNIFVNQVMMIQYMLYLAVVMIGIIQARKYTQLIQLEMGIISISSLHFMLLLI